MDRVVDSLKLEEMSDSTKEMRVFNTLLNRDENFLENPQNQSWLLYRKLESEGYFYHSIQKVNCKFSVGYQGSKAAMNIISKVGYLMKLIPQIANFSNKIKHLWGVNIWILLLNYTSKIPFRGILEGNFLAYN